MYWGIQHIAKKDTWFKFGSSVYVLEDFGNGSGLFRGPRICQCPESEGYELGEEYIDRQILTFNDFIKFPYYEKIIIDGVCPYEYSDTPSNMSPPAFSPSNIFKSMN